MPHQRKEHPRQTSSGRTNVRRTMVKDRAKEKGREKVQQADRVSDNDKRARVAKAAGKKGYEEKKKGSDNKTAVKEGAKAGIDEV